MRTIPQRNHSQTVSKHLNMIMNYKIALLLILLISSCKESNKTSEQNKPDLLKKEVSKSNLKTEKDNEIILLENSTERTFSNPDSKDNFKIIITGNSLHDGKMTFQIINAKGNFIHNEEFPSYYLIGYELFDDEPKEKQKEYIKKRVAEFFKDDNFFSPAISENEQYDEDYSDLKEWNDIKSDSTAVGFYYLIGEESGNRIAFSKKENKIVIYFSCC